MTAKQHLDDAETEISLLDTINFLRSVWKKLATAVAVGALLGLGSWLFLGKYTAEFRMSNSQSYGLDLVSWRTIQNGLPTIAAKIVQSGKEQKGRVELYRTLSSAEWWQKNVIPSFAFSKDDAKDLSVVSASFTSASTTILSFVISFTGNSRESVLDSAREAAQFMRSGAAYLQLQSILNAYEGEVISDGANVQKKISSTQIEIAYQLKRVNSLEELDKLYRSSHSNSQQVIATKGLDSSPFLITNQIMSAKNDANQSKEVLSRMSDRLERIALIKVFLDQALPLAESTFDGMVLNEELLTVVTKLRSEASKDNLSKQEALNEIDAELLRIKARFSKGLSDASPTGDIVRRGIVKFTVAGSTLAFFLMIISLLSQIFWRNFIKSGEK